MDEIKVEIWKDIKDYPKYQISNFGRVKSKKRITNVGIKNVEKIIRNEKILKPLKLTKGYLGIRLLYFLNNGGEYKELGRIENAEITPEEDKDDTEMKDYINKTESYDGELTVDIKDREAIRRIKQLLKTDIQKKAEQRYNKQSFRKFIKNKLRRN